MMKAAFRFLLVLMMIPLLAACGGGGDGPVTGGGGATGGGDTAATSSPTLALELLDSSGAALTQVTESQSGILTATVLNAAGVPVEGALVTFSISQGAGSGELDPASGTALTNVNGIATLALKAGDVEGAGEVSASVTVDGETVSGADTFSTALADLDIGRFDNSGLYIDGQLDSSLTSGQLSAGGNMTFTASVVTSSNDTLFTTPVEVSFSAACADATIDESVTTQSGLAQATYQANSCTGTDTITATIPGGQSAQATVSIATATPGSIEFVSASPETISLQGVANATSPATSTVKFIVRDVNDNPLAGQTVNFALTSTIGGLNIPSGSETATSNSQGEVTTRVNSGTVPATVRVKASFTSGTTEISTFSSQLTVSVGLPDQDSFSLAAEVLNPEAWNIDGVQVGITIRASDQFNHAVPDGTAIVMQAEGGRLLGGGTCTTTDGACTVTWDSSDPRPSADSAVPGDRAGRVTIVATTVGEESYTDADGDGRFDAGESFDDLPEAFRDDNENSSRESGEPFRDFTQNSQYDAADSLYNGALCASAAQTLGHCANLIEVRDELVIVMASPPTSATLSPSSANVSGGGFVTVSVTVADVNGNAPPAGTTVAFETSAGKLFGQTSFTVPSTTEPVTYAVVLGSAEPDDPKSGLLTVEATAPSGIGVSNAIAVTDGP